ncbi:hypothetical protein CALCODRAFT_358523 [Calocera cornea HHB12733]|uniref:Uncharacterized protein n=1 Tax=Calocera cornea HHB12733 TaxID=1353952 RepID=A0A165EN57_9BASI|nr:hypothetical protein CALCODRAFT_358523 [Calocera cornea HHB12733]
MPTIILLIRQARGGRSTAAEPRPRPRPTGGETDISPNLTQGRGLIRDRAGQTQCHRMILLPLSSDVAPKSQIGISGVTMVLVSHRKLFQLWNSYRNSPSGCLIRPCMRVLLGECYWMARAWRVCACEMSSGSHGPVLIASLYFSAYPYTAPYSTHASLSQRKSHPIPNASQP